MPIFPPINTDFSNELNIAIQNFTNRFNYYFSHIQIEIDYLLSNSSVSYKNIERLKILNTELNLVDNCKEAVLFTQKLTTTFGIIYKQINHQPKEIKAILDELNEITGF